MEQSPRIPVLAQAEHGEIGHEIVAELQTHLDEGIDIDGQYGLQGIDIQRLVVARLLFAQQLHRGQVRLSQRNHHQVRIHAVDDGRGSLGLMTQPRENLVFALARLQCVRDFDMGKD